MKNISGKFTMTHKYVCVPIVHVCRKLYFVRLKCEIGSDVLFTHFVGNAAVDWHIAWSTNCGKPGEQVFYYKEVKDESFTNGGDKLHWLQFGSESVK